MPTKPYSLAYVLSGNIIWHLVLSSELPPDTKSVFTTVVHSTYNHLVLDPAIYPSAVLAGYTNGDAAISVETKENPFDANEFDQPFLTIVESISAKVTLQSRSILNPIWAQLRLGQAYERNTSVASPHIVDFRYGDRDAVPLNYGIVGVAENRGNHHVAWIPNIRLAGKTEEKLKKGGLVESGMEFMGQFLATHPFPYASYDRFTSDPDA